MGGLELMTGTDRRHRVVGGLFHGAVFAATSVGLVALALLVAVVAWDALGLGAADWAWMATVAGAGGGSLLLAVRLVRGEDDRRIAATSMTIAIVGGAIVGVFAIVMLLIVTPSVLFAYALTAGLPGVAVLILAPDHRYRHPTAVVVLASGAVAGTFFLEPIVAIARLAKPWLLLFITVAVPVAMTVGYTFRSRLGPTRSGLVGGGIAVGSLVVMATVPAPDPLDGGLVGVFLLCLTGPATVVAWHHGHGRRFLPGVVAPLLVPIGVGVGVLAATGLGLAGPEPWLDWGFLTSPHSRHPEQAGLYPAIIGSFFLMVVMAVFAFPVSIGAAIYLEEFAPQTGGAGRLVRLLQVNIANLAGVPSVVYGLLGLAIIARTLRLGVGAITTAALTLGLLIMPITIIATQEAIRAVPDERRAASAAMGADPWTTVRRVVLPEALPGVFTGTILALGRAIGETAPLIMVGAATTVYSPPTTLGGSATAMPMQIFAWAGEFVADFRTGVLSAGVLTLLLAMLSLNAIAILLRNRYERGQ